MLDEHGRWSRRAAAAMLVLLAATPSVAEPDAAGAVSATSRFDAGPAGYAVRTRLQYEGTWGSAAAVAAVAPGAARPILVATGVQMGGALIGPVRLAGAWRELARPLGHDAAARVYRERTGLLPDSGIEPGRLRGVQIEPLPGVAAAGYIEPGPAASGGPRAPAVLAAVVAGEPLPALSVEAYTAVRTAVAAQLSTRWLLPAAPFPGGELTLAGARARIAAGDGELAGTVNVSLGPSLPVALHGRLSARVPVPYGVLAVAAAVAGREFRGLGGEATAQPLTWAIRLTGTGGPRWRVGYRWTVRGAAPARSLHADATGVAVPHTVELAVTPTVPLGAMTLGGEGAVVAAAAGAVPAVAIRARARPGALSVRWRGAKAGSTLQVLGSAQVAPVTVEAAWRAASGRITTRLAVEIEVQHGRLRITAAGLGDPPRKGPRLTVAISVEP